MNFSEHRLIHGTHRPPWNFLSTSSGSFIEALLHLICYAPPPSCLLIVPDRLHVFLKVVSGILERRDQ